MKLTEWNENDIPALSAFFARAMQADPLYAAMIPDPAERELVLPRLFEKYFTDYRGALTVLYTPDRAGAICFCEGSASGEERLALPPDLQAYYARMEDALASDYYEDFLLLDLLAVAPEARGKGYARELIAAFSAACRKAGKTGVAEIYNEKNIGLYERTGFRCAHRVAHGGLTAFLMEMRV